MASIDFIKVLLFYQKIDFYQSCNILIYNEYNLLSPFSWRKWILP